MSTIWGAPRFGDLSCENRSYPKVVPQTILGAKMVQSFLPKLVLAGPNLATNVGPLLVLLPYSESRQMAIACSFYAMTENFRLKR